MQLGSATKLAWVASSNTLHASVPVVAAAAAQQSLNTAVQAARAVASQVGSSCCSLKSHIQIIGSLPTLLLRSLCYRLKQQQEKQGKQVCLVCSQHSYLKGLVVAC